MPDMNNQFAIKSLNPTLLFPLQMAAVEMSGCHRETLDKSALQPPRIRRNSGTESMNDKKKPQIVIFYRVTPLSHYSSDKICEIYSAGQFVV